LVWRRSVIPTVDTTEGVGAVAQDLIHLDDLRDAQGIRHDPIRVSSANKNGDEDEPIRLSLSARLKRTGMEMKFVVDGPRDSAPADASLVRLLIRAQKIGRRLFETGAPTLEEIAREEGIAPSYATRVVRLTFLAPDIVAAILAGKQPPELTANKLMADTRLPLDWRGQRTALGFA
jgi:site-specific DNA recombinase